MARIIVSSYVVRFPVGGYLSWVLQWLVGFQRLGHDVYFVEKCGWSNGCYNPDTDRMGDDWGFGIASLDALLSQFELGGHWSFVDADANYHGIERERLAALFKSADLFIDLGLAHGEWTEEAGAAALRVFVDSDPGFTQMMWDQYLAEDVVLPSYDFHYSVGQNIGTEHSPAPLAGRAWRTVLNPVNLDLFPVKAVDRSAPFTTIMSWQGRGITFNGFGYGSKDVEFAKFFGLPRLTAAPLEVAVGGAGIPVEDLTASGWRVRDSVAVTRSFDDFRSYLSHSRGEFSVAKNAYVATNSGWFSDRGGAYLASGRPVVLQETGFSRHLPCGRGLFAVRTVEDAAAAIDAIAGDWDRHSAAAREIAGDCLDATKVLGRFLVELGL